MKLTITQEEIDEALKLRQGLSIFLASINCPVSLAASKLFKVDCTSAFGKITVPIGIAETKIYTAPGLHTFQAKFDTKQGVKPTEFEIEEVI